MADIVDCQHCSSISAAEMDHDPVSKHTYFLRILQFHKLRTNCCGSGCIFKSVMYPLVYHPFIFPFYESYLCWTSSKLLLHLQSNSSKDCRQVLCRARLSMSSFSRNEALDRGSTLALGQIGSEVFAFGCGNMTMVFCFFNGLKMFWRMDTKSFTKVCFAGFLNQLLL